jgi:hypothetical protein
VETGKIGSGIVRFLGCTSALKPELFHFPGLRDGDGEFCAAQKIRFYTGLLLIFSYNEDLRRIFNS